MSILSVFFLTTVEAKVLSLMASARLEMASEVGFSIVVAMLAPAQSALVYVKSESKEVKKQTYGSPSLGAMERMSSVSATLPKTVM